MVSCSFHLAPNIFTANEANGGNRRWSSAMLDRSSVSVPGSTTSSRIVNEARTFPVPPEGSQRVLLAVSIGAGHAELGSLTVM